jgi:hypothetical protein
VGLDTVREKLAVHLDGGDIKSDDLIESSAVAGAASVGIVPPAPPFGEPGAPADLNGTGCRDPDDKTIRHDRPQSTEPFGEASEDPNPDMSTSEATLRPPPDQSRLMDLKSLRARAWTLAQRIAQRHGLENLIQPLVGKGLGFVVRDVPDAALLEQLAEDELAQVSTVWWQLAACAEITVAPLGCILPLVEEGSVLRRALEDQDAGLLFDSVWTLDPGNTGYRLWRRLDDRAWQDLCGLMDTYRALHNVAEATGSSLWGRADVRD